MFGCSKEPSYEVGSFEYLYHIYIWLKNKKNSFHTKRKSVTLGRVHMSIGNFHICLNREKMRFWCAKALTCLGRYKDYLHYVFYRQYVFPDSE